MSDEEDLGLDGVFPEEERPPTPPPAIKYYTRPTGEQLSVQLVTTHPLWGHVLYPTSICLSDYLSEHAAELVYDKTVLELGAGGGLPSLVCALEGATRTVVTDFPDSSLISNLQRNIDANIPPGEQASIIAEGYTWGSKIDKLLRSLPESRKHFDTVLAADLVFNHSQHLALLKSCEACLSGSDKPVLLCFYAHHRPTKELIAKDEGFVQLAQERGWKTSRVVRKTDAGPAFPEDGGDLAIRSTVHGFKLIPPQRDAQT